jgi:hypothetical protein
MLRTALAIFMIGGMAAWGQAQNETSDAADKVNRATAYYHYTLAHLYAEMATASGGTDSECVNKAIENYKAAIHADPRTSLLSEELSEINRKRARPVRAVPAPRLPASR